MYSTTAEWPSWHAETTAVLPSLAVARRQSGHLLEPLLELLLELLELLVLLVLLVLLCWSCCC